MARRNHDDDPVLDANDAVRWAVIGGVRTVPVIALLDIAHTLGWSFWVTILVGIAVAAVGGAAYPVVRRLCVERWARHAGSTRPGPNDDGDHDVGQRGPSSAR